MKTILTYLSLLFLAIFITSCGENKIDMDTPYGLEIKEVRSYYKALDIQDRLSDKGFDSYIISCEAKDGNWYKIILGAEDSIEEINEFKESFEGKLPLKQLKIVNYQMMENDLILDFKEKIKENKRLKSTKPKLPGKVFELINKFPEEDNFIVKSFFVNNSPDSLKNLGKFKAAYKDIKTDLPRGIYLYGLMKSAKCLAEVIYEDNIYGDQVTIDMIMLRDSLNFDLPEGDMERNLKIADYYANKVLETGKYKFEDKLKIEVSSFQKLEGYKVKIQPRRNSDVIRTYFCLVSRDSKYLIFSQSTDKTDEEILDIIDEFGESKGLESYDEFYNALYTLPINCNINDEFVSISSQKLTYSYAKSRRYAAWSKKMVGHWQTSVNFNGIENRNWSVSFFDLLNAQNVDKIYSDLYIKNTKKNRSTKTLDVLGKQGVIHKNKYPHELSFPGNRFVISINNNSYGRMTEEAMLNAASCLQLD